VNILFVCTGNTCRSPLAEAVAKRVAERRGVKDVRVSSAGVSAWQGAPASDGALLVGMERQLDLAAHRARVLTRDLVAEADLIFAMTSAHLEQVLELGGRGKAHVLDEYSSPGANMGGITDPFGGELSAYRETADLLEREIGKLFDRLER